MDRLRDSFCRAFAGRSLLFVGDSIMGQWVSSFAHVLGKANANEGECFPGQGLLPFVLDFDVCASARSAGRAPVRLRFVRNELLLFNYSDAATRPLRNAKYKQQMCEWASKVHEAEVVVLNRGIHWQPDESFAAVLRETLASLAALPPPASGRRRRIVYRGTHAPVPGCNPALSPSAVSLESRLYSKYYMAHNPHHHWPDFDRQNQIARCIARAHGALYIDVWRMMTFRPDAALDRSDCVHSCMPGPVDEWSRLLLAFLVADADGSGMTL
ncbi:hypothetical protein KFE25_002973 [Diacronema lutheri]|uniref:Trichome birefringence-like C-terminal domain-containing protein n=1 Tax=Diacronema lutheri TaxID=2081491 RepID=A0A8J6CC30_DIALT|nr:hypothetical protein KFE25_002973 [Diacronema lutheri]|mmetsp:Transcript_16205/g.50485  ORF Transcript_16205/g.50485 Transcript_16205/m.50485 type:complete len:270 (-) Transcript_16205:25-834(-)